MSTTTSRTALLVLSVLLGLLEIVDGFRLELPWMAWAYALLLLGGSYWLWRSPTGAPVLLLGALHLLELLMLLLVFRTAEQAPSTALLLLFVLLSAGGTLAAAAVLMGRSHAARA
jgi:hypothetical protein